MQDTKKLLGQRIKELRKLNKLTQEELAEAVGIDPKHLSSIETGRNSPTLLTLEKISGALNVQIKTLFDSQSNNRAEVHDLIDLADERQFNMIRGVVKVVIGN